MFTKLMNDLEAIQKDVVAKIEEVKEAENKIIALQEQVLSLENQVANLEEEKANHVCQCDHSELEGQIESLKAQVVALKKEIAEHKCPVCDHSEMEAQISKLQQVRGELEASIQAKDEIISQHEQNLVLLQAEVDELKKLLMTN
jgi:chromosome segregation ATPase